MRTRFSILLIVLSLVFGWQGFSFAQSLPRDGQVKVEDVSVVMSEVGPVILLKAQKRVVPIFVDPTVAGSIDGALRGMKMSRPLSHDLMHTILQEFGGTVTDVHIKLKGQIYYGELGVAIDGYQKLFDPHQLPLPALHSRSAPST